MTEPYRTLERSLHDGPPDEAGYRSLRRELELELGAFTTGMTPVQRVIPLPRPRRAQAWSARSAAAAVLVAAIALGGLALVNRHDESSFVGPPASASATSDQRPSDGPSAEPTIPPSSRPSAGEGPTASAVPIPELTRTFVSPRNGFSINYPANWTATPATESWPPDTFTQLGSPELDQLELAGTARLVVASQRLGTGQTEGEWVAAYFRPFQGDVTCDRASDLPSSPRLPIDGRSAYLDLAGCPMNADAALSPGDVVFDAFVFSDDRVYQVTLDGDVDLGYFKALVATMRLDPASAIDPPPSTP
jgi:hypothetical protein